MKKMKNCIKITLLLSSSTIFAQAGIGTATPSATLDIVSKGNTSATKALEVNNSSAVEMLTVLNNGNVGIGTAAPSEILDVAGNVKFSGALKPNNFAGTADQVLTSSGGGANIWKNISAIGLSTASNGLTSTSGDVKLGGALIRPTTISGLTATNKMSFIGTGLDAFNVDNGTLSVDAANDRVGIGTASPTNTFSVSNSKDGAGIMSIDNAAPGGFSGLYFLQGGSYKGHIGHVNTGGSNAFGGAGTYQLVSGNRPMAFSVGNVGNEQYVERMRITQAGFVGIGTSTPTATLHVVGTTLSALWSTTSDARLKSNIIPVKEGLAEVMNLKPVNYDKKYSLNSNETTHENGFIAQELEKIVPSVVSIGIDKDKLYSVNYSGLIPVLTKAIQEQQAEIEVLKEQVKRLLHK